MLNRFIKATSRKRPLSNPSFKLKNLMLFLTRCICFANVHSFSGISAVVLVSVLILQMKLFVASTIEYDIYLLSTADSIK